MQLPVTAFEEQALTLAAWRATGCERTLDQWVLGWGQLMRAEARGLRPLSYLDFADVEQEWRVLLWQFQPLYGATGDGLRELFYETRTMLKKLLDAERERGARRVQRGSGGKAAPRELPPPEWAADGLDHRAEGDARARLLLIAVRQELRAEPERRVLAALLTGQGAEEMAAHAGMIPRRFRRHQAALRQRLRGVFVSELAWVGQQEELS